MTDPTLPRESELVEAMRRLSAYADRIEAGESPSDAAGLEWGALIDDIRLLAAIRSRLVEEGERPMEHDADYRALPDPILRAARPVEVDPERPSEEQFVRLATAVMQVREFIALHLKTKRRSDVNGRKVLALLDEALAGSSPEPRKP